LNNDHGIGMLVLTVSRNDIPTSLLVFKNATIPRARAYFASGRTMNLQVPQLFYLSLMSESISPRSSSVKWADSPGKKSFKNLFFEVRTLESWYHIVPRTES
jgi:hypothetical protein